MDLFSDWLPINAPDVYAYWLELKANEGDVEPYDNLNAWAAKYHPATVDRFYQEIVIPEDTAKRTRPRVYMPADNLLRMRGRSAKDAIGPTRVQGKGGEAKVLWTYPDCTVTLQLGGRPLCWRVQEVTGGES